MNKNYYSSLFLIMSVWSVYPTFNGFDMSMDKPITGLPMIPDQLYAPADSDPVHKVKLTQKRVSTRRAAYRKTMYRMVTTRQENDTLFPWANHKKRGNQRIENF